MSTSRRQTIWVHLTKQELARSTGTMAQYISDITALVSLRDTDFNEMWAFKDVGHAHIIFAI